MFSTIIAFSVITGCGDKRNTESLNSSEDVTNSISTGGNLQRLKDNTGFPVTMKHAYVKQI